MMIRRSNRLVLTLIACGQAGDAVGQAVADQIGLTELRARLGASTPTGEGVTLMLVEGETAQNTYMPSATAPELLRKTIIDRSTNGADSTHATSVATIGFGDFTGIAPDVLRIDTFKVFDWPLGPGDWLTDSYLNFGGGLPVVCDDLFVQNHSWTAGAQYDASTLEVIRRTDHALRRDDVVAVAGVANSPGIPVPPMLGACYNAISVGNANGQSSYGPVGGEGAGRSKPDIVGPYGVTSYSTPVVSGCAAMLRQTAEEMGEVDRARAETIKAVLLSGATKEEFAQWPAPWRRLHNGVFLEPLDRRFGAGEVNIDNSHRILSSNEKDGTDLTLDGPEGWDYEAVTEADGVRRYYVHLGLGRWSSFSATVTWMRRVTPTGKGENAFATSEATLSTIELRLFAVNPDMSIGSLIDQSISPIDNVQHLFQPDLPGNRRYKLEVRLVNLPSGQQSEHFAVAWHAKRGVRPEMTRWR